MEDIVRADMVSVRIRQHGVRQVEFPNGLPGGLLRVCAERDQLRVEFFDFVVVRLQLTELFLAERSGVHPVEDDKNVLLTLEILQVDRRTLDGHSSDARRLAFLGSRGQQPSQGEDEHHRDS